MIKVNDDFAAVLGGLFALCKLEMEGKFESPEADLIRNVMDGPWSRLSEEEQLRVHELSAKLNALHAQAMKESPDDQSSV
jgi:hypothetical protein